MSDVVKTKLEELAASIETPTRPLGLVIDKLRSELAALNRDSGDKNLQFQVEEIEVELQVGITAGADGEIGFDCWLYNAKVNATFERASTQTVKLKLKPKVRVEPGDSATPASATTDLHINSSGRRSE